MDDLNNSNGNDDIDEEGKLVKRFKRSFEDLDGLLLLFRHLFNTII